jgi:flavin-dependent dehydrogenase
MEAGPKEAAMGAGRYDVIVVGARVAGAATAMLLARRGLRVLAVDRVAFPSDTISSRQLAQVAVRRGAGPVSPHRLKLPGREDQAGIPGEG